MAVMIALAWNANGMLAAQEKTPPKKTATKKKGTPARKSGVSRRARRVPYSQEGHQHGVARKPGTTTKSASSRGKKAPAEARHVAQPADDSLRRTVTARFRAPWHPKVF